MKKKSLLSMLALATVVVTLSVASVAKADTIPAQVQKIKDAGVLKVGVKQDVPNFGYYSAQSGTYEGMEIDIARKIAKAMKVKVDFTAVTPQTREAMMDNGQLDIVIATYSITPERQASYSFTDPYYVDELGFLVNKAKGYSSIKDLNDKTIGVSQGSTAKAALEEYASAHNLTFHYSQLGSYPELAISLYANRIDGFLGDKSILSGYRSSKTALLSDGFNTQTYGIATKKTNTQVTSYINKLLAKWKTDGSLNKIYAKYDLTPAESN